VVTQINDLKKNFPRAGQVVWLGLRTDKRAPMQICREVVANVNGGLEGDHYRGKNQSARQVTLMQSEHLAVIAALLGKENISPGLLRRNIVVSGINLLALKEYSFQIGDAVLTMTGLCHPCSRMEQALGPGGFNAMRGHGGITARVLKGGRIGVGDTVSLSIAENLD
jgi:MOSC domain-containing protein YiiM